MQDDAVFLLTRPRAASERFAHQLQQALGPVKTVIAPLMEIVLLPVPPEAADAATVLFTSLHGVEAWEESGLPCTAQCYCVGEATAEAARALGFEALASAGSLEHMLPDVLAAAPPDPMVHIHGRHIRGDLAAALRQAGYRAQGYPVYEQHLLPLPTAAQDLLTSDARVIVPLFSPRSAAHFASLCPALARPEIVAISRNAAEHWPEATVAQTPDAPAMIAAIVKRLRSV